MSYFDQNYHCTQCFQKGKKSIALIDITGLDGNKHKKCPKCKIIYASKKEAS